MIKLKSEVKRGIAMVVFLVDFTSALPVLWCCKSFY